MNFKTVSKMQNEGLSMNKKSITAVVVAYFMALLVLGFFGHPQ